MEAILLVTEARREDARQRLARMSRERLDRLGWTTGSIVALTGGFGDGRPCGSWGNSSARPWRPTEITCSWRSMPATCSIVAVDASGTGKAQITLSGAEGATDATGVGGGWAAVLAGAVVKATGLVQLNSLKQVTKNPDGAQFGYDQALVYELPAAAIQEG